MTLPGREPLRDPAELAAPRDGIADADFEELRAHAASARDQPRPARLLGHPWQVVQMWPGGGMRPRCTHRWEVVAGWCSELRDLPALFRDRPDGSYHDIRHTPEETL